MNTVRSAYLCHFRKARVPVVRLAGLLRCNFLHLQCSLLGKVSKCKGEYLYGTAPCIAAIRAKRRKIFKAFVTEPSEGSSRKSQSDILEACQERGIPVHSAPRRTLDRLIGDRPHQGIVLDVSPLKFTPVDFTEDETMFAPKKQGQFNSLWLALDSVQDPMNFGAILRCTYYFGVERVVVPMKNSCSLTPTVSKASSGAMELMEVSSVKSLPLFLQVAKEHAWTVAGTCSPTCEDDVYKGVPILDCSHFSLKSPTIVVLGNEGLGLQEAVERVCTLMLTIPSLRQQQKLQPNSTIESLNVSVAAGVILHSLLSPVVSAQNVHL